jgi:DNA-binding HxlR family transcriptional regulator
MADSTDLEATRLLIDLLADKWTIPIMGALCSGGGRQRFNAIRREVPAISQKSLVTCLKRLEMNGLIERHVSTVGELAVEYRMTPLGHTLDEPVGALLRWSGRHEKAVRKAQQDYAERAEASAGEWGLEVRRSLPLRLAS